MVNWIFRENVELSMPRTTDPDSTRQPALSADDVGANVWEITVMQDESPADLNGANAEAVFTCENFEPVTASGTISENTVRVKIPANVYKMRGRVCGSVNLKYSDYSKITISRRVFRVHEFF